MQVLDLAWVKTSPEGALAMIEELMRERDEARNMAGAAAAGFAAMKEERDAERRGRERSEDQGKRVNTLADKWSEMK
jgi:hypothetical protein